MAEPLSKGRTLRLIVAFVLLSVSLGCNAIREIDRAHIQADVNFRDSVVARVESEYIPNDSALSSTEKQSLLIAIRAWKAMVRVASNRLEDDA